MRKSVKKLIVCCVMLALLISLSTTTALAGEIYGTNTDALAAIGIDMETLVDLSGNILAVASIQGAEIQQVMEKAQNEDKKNVIFDVTTKEGEATSTDILLPKMIFTYYTDSFVPDLWFRADHGLYCLESDLLLMKREELGDVNLDVQMDGAGLVVQGTRSQIVKQEFDPIVVKLELEFYDKDAFVELTEEMFIMAGEKARKEGANCILFDFTTEKVIEGYTYTILKQEWTKYIKVDNKYVTCKFRWNEGEMNFEPSYLEKWETNWIGRANEFSVLMWDDGMYLMTSGRVYPAGLKAHLEAEKESETRRLINGVENTTIKLTTIRGKGYIKLNWKKDPGYKVDYYEVFRSTKRNSGYGTKPFYTTNNGSKTYYKNTKSLKAGTRYYFKVRGVRVIDGKKYYTQYSNKAYRTAIK